MKWVGLVAFGLGLVTVAVLIRVGGTDRRAPAGFDEVGQEGVTGYASTAPTLAPAGFLGNVGAHIAESNDMTLHVDQNAPSASDENEGSQSQPLRTIQAALDTAQVMRDGSTGVRILVQPGTYRESITIAPNEPDASSLIIEAAESGSVSVSGSDVWDDWEPEADMTTYVHQWPFEWGSSPEVEGIGGRREMVFIDGDLLTPVNDRSDLTGMSFIVDEEQRQIVIHAPGIDVGDSVVEVAARPRLLDADGVSNLIIRGLTFEHAASEFDSTAVEITNASNVVFSKNVISGNSWTGLGLGTSNNISLVGNMISDNGGGGIGAFRQVDLLMDGNTTSRNNWRGERSNYLGWSIAGIKMVGGSRISIMGHTSNDNKTRGLWLDYDVSDVAIEQSVFCGNLTDGVMLEAIPGFVDFRASVVCGNARRGLVIVNAVDVAVSGTEICQNAETAIHLDAEPGGRIIETDTGPVDLPPVEGLTLNGNLIGGSPVLFRANLSTEEWRIALETFASDLNEWGTESREPFRVPGMRGELSDWVESWGLDAGSLDEGSEAC